MLALQGKPGNVEGTSGRLAVDDDHGRRGEVRGGGRRSDDDQDRRDSRRHSNGRRRTPSRSRSRRRLKRKDRGPFGTDVPQRGRSQSDSPFREASPSSGRMSHMRLVEYSRAHPGQLGVRLLQKTKELVCHGGEATHIEEGKTPAAATVYFHSVFMPSHRDIGLRNSREGRTLCRGLDLLANREYGQLADLLAQRLKALEKSYLDGNHWSQAQWLELLPPEGTTLLDRSEEYMASREEELSGRLSSSWKGKGKDQDWSSSWKGEGKYEKGGKPKGSGKVWKGGKKSGK